MEKLIGSIIHHYEIIDQIGQGGMGVVFKAVDQKLKRPVALKFLNPKSLTESSFKKRFEREAQTAASLNHPNIVTIYEINEYQDQIFIAMEFLEGATLQELIEKDFFQDNRGYKIHKIIDILKQISNAIHFAHQAGVIHCDIKPQNIIVVGESMVKILDFGIAKLIGVNTFVKKSTVMGSVYYMAPEQLLGEDLDYRIDIWSIGVILYEMITGKKPFYHSSVLKTINEIIGFSNPLPLIQNSDELSPFAKIFSKTLQTNRDIVTKASKRFSLIWRK